MTARRTRDARKRRLIGIGILVALLIAMALGTNVVSNATAKRAASDGIDPATFAKENFSSKLVLAITEQSVDVVVVANAIETDPASAAKKYAKSQGSNAPVYSVKVTGLAGKATSDGLMPVVVKGMPDKVEIFVQMGPAINGTAIRDATGDIKFQQFTNQLAYQDSATELNKQVKSKVLGKVKTADLAGQSVTVVGAFQYGNPQAYIVTPVRVEATR